MGTTLWGCRQRTARGSSLQDTEDRNVGLATSIIKFVKQRCMCTAKKKRKRQLHLHLQEKKQHMLKKTEQLVTLGEWILASPSLNVSFTDEGDQFQVCKPTSNCNRVHPSFDRTQESCVAKSRENLKLKSTSAKLGEEARKFVESSLCRSQSSKIKKKVSFRLPEVADIFILASPEGHSDKV